MQNSIWLSLASTLLLACNNPAPLDDAAEAAGAPAALDRIGGACQLAQRVDEPSPEQSRGLYAAPTADGTVASTHARCSDSLSGSYGLRVDLDVLVDPSAEHDPGRGRASLLLRADIDPSADVALRLCGLELPARYAYASSAVTQLEVADDIWDGVSMPVWKSHIRSADQTLQIDAFPVLLGITLPAPGAPWPSFDQTPAFDCGAGKSGSDCFPDHDADREPGISFRVQTVGEVEDAPYPACGDWARRAPSTDNHAWSSNAATDANRMFVGLRTALQLFPRFDESCTQATGHARAADIMMRALDCELTDGQRCSPRQATVIDQRAPTFHVLEARETPPESFRDSRWFVDEALDRSPSTGGQVALRRLPDAAWSCAAVRAMFAR